METRVSICKATRSHTVSRNLKETNPLRATFLRTGWELLLTQVDRPLALFADFAELRESCQHPRVTAEGRNFLRRVCRSGNRVKAGNRGCDDGEQRNGRE